MWSQRETHELQSIIELCESSNVASAIGQPLKRNLIEYNIKVYISNLIIIFELVRLTDDFAPFKLKVNNIRTIRFSIQDYRVHSLDLFLSGW